MRGIQTALAFLTVLPAGGRNGGAGPGEAGGLAWYAAVGVVVGVLLAAAMAGARELWPPVVSAGITVLCWVVITGGLHLDGLADTADAAFAPVTRARRLEILRDVYHGTFAVVAVVLVLLLKFSVLASVELEQAVSLLLLAPTFARAVVVPVARWTAQARSEGLGRGFRRHANVGPVAACAVTAALLSAVILGWPGLLVLAGTFAFGAALALGLSRHFGGLTGDMLGGLVELTETAALLGGAALFEHGLIESFPWGAWR